MATALQIATDREHVEFDEKEKVGHGSVPSVSSTGEC